MTGLLENGNSTASDDGSKKESKKDTSKNKNVETLVDNSVITTQELEQDFFQDPLFQKTAADFDQGGAQGLLLSHLDISSQGRIIFDGSDCHLDTIIEEVQEFTLDLMELKSKFGSKLDLLHSQLICPTFANFKFSSKEFEEYTIENRQDFYHEPLDLSDVENYNDFDDHMSMGNDDLGFREDYGQIVTNQTNEGEVSISEKMMKIVGSTNISQDNGKYSYFDKGHQWAGPQFWKSRLAPSSKQNKPTTTKKKQKLDFSQKLSRKEVFARKVSTTFGKSGGFKKKSELLLPEDFGVGPQVFQTLFLKPLFKVEEYISIVKKPMQVSTNTFEDNNNYDNDFGGMEHDNGN